MAKKRHWSSQYLKRINSTEVTVRRREGGKAERSYTVVEGVGAPETHTYISSMRSPDRVINTPKRSINILTPTQQARIECSPTFASKRRLYY